MGANPSATVVTTWMPRNASASSVRLRCRPETRKRGQLPRLPAGRAHHAEPDAEREQDERNRAAAPRQIPERLRACRRRQQAAHCDSSGQPAAQTTAPLLRTAGPAGRSATATPAPPRRARARRCWRRSPRRRSGRRRRPSAKGSRPAGRSVDRGCGAARSGPPASAAPSCSNWRGRRSGSRPRARRAARRGRRRARPASRPAEACPQPR